MHYVSTRGLSPKVSFTEAVAHGLAPDGGLYLPEHLPDLSRCFAKWKSLSYPELCLEFLSLFATDIGNAQLQTCIIDAYSGFDHPEIAPLVRLDQRTWVCELFHGPTLAFKDFALQLLGKFYALQIQKTGIPITVLGATSGDTGSAAIHGLMNLPGIRIFILFPEGKVSPLQERQMTCTGASQVFPIAIDGTFDDAQRWVKDLFGDLDFKKRHNLSAINSINLARILAQCVYYLYAWFRIPAAAQENLEIVVPTGNFGNILAGWMLSRMGLPIPAFRIATNCNDILCRLFESGTYETSAVDPSLAPSMDIQVASNFERFIYYMLGSDPEKVRTVMHQFRSTGKVHFPDFDRNRFHASRTSDQQILDTIQEIHTRFGYIPDPHTACGLHELSAERDSLVMATAHPAKFPEAIHKAIGIRPSHPSLETLRSKSPVRYRLGSDPAHLRVLIEEQMNMTEST